MKMKLAGFILALILSIPLTVLSQRGKDGSYTVTAANVNVNTYTTLSANAAAGATSITVASNALSGANFTGNLAQGDLILIIQMQGASVSIDTIQAADATWGGWGGQFTCPIGYVWDANWLYDATKVAEFGKILAYNNSGKFEQVEVLSVSGSTTINLNCALQNSYTASGKVQIVRIPRYVDLTINNSMSIVPPAWNGSTGGVTAVEVNGNLSIGTGAKFSASGRGFRGGSTTSPSTQVGFAGSSTQHGYGNGNGATQMGAEVGTEGARKGEGIGGSNTEYTVLHSPFGRGAIANGGGGAGYQNAGGGGGSNVGSGTYTGKGVPSSVYANSIWNLELAGFAGSVSPGGGRGGYSLNQNDLNAATQKPNLSTWGVDARKENGGLGGHPLALDATRLFMGGGGGAGDQDSGQAGPGGAGGGIVMITCYGSVSGAGSVEADGANGSNSNPLGQSAGIGAKKGNDGGGGAGGGGAIYFKNMTAIPATISLLARGGSGGNHALSLGTGAAQESGGPGAGGGGGQITYTSGTPTVAVTGGTNGICTVNTGTSLVSEFPANGATNGGSGLTSSSTIYNIIPNNVTICSGNTATPSVTVSGTSPGTLYWYSTQYGGSSIASGLSYTTPVLATTTTYYVGTCPGTFRVPVVVTVTPSTTTTFNQVAPICSGATLTLPATSIQGFTGTWSPAVNNTATTLYTFTPTAGQCASTATMTVTVNPSTTSTFTQVAPICSGGSFTLPATSNEGFTGSWSPAINNTATTLYTFTPTPGQCASTATMTVTVNAATTPTFTQVAPICTGGSFTLPAASNNGINGSWLPAINNTATTLYTFTPTAGQCATTATMTVTVNPLTTPTFTQVAPICSGGSFTLPTTSNNAITGSWLPAINNTATTTYTFTPDAGQCANTATMTVSVGAPSAPTFTQVAPICQGGSFTLPSTSNESFTGTWSPAINNAATTLYTFTPTAGQCATTATMTVTVNTPTAATFTQVAPICQGGSFTLPGTSDNGFNGTWSPAIDNMATTLYTFSPTAGQCASGATMTVTVNTPTAPTFTQVAPICSGGSFTLPTTSNNGINGTWSPAINNTATTLYTFTPTAGQCASTATMTVTVNSPTAATFTQVSAICQGGSFTLPTTSNNGFLGSWSPAINNMATTTYTFTPNAGQCASSATMTVTVNTPVTPTFTPWGPYCQNDILAQVMLPSSSLEGITGVWNPGMVSTAVAGNIVYSFTSDAGQCANNTTMTVVVNAQATPTFTQVAPICTGGSFTLPSSSLEGIPGTWSPAINNTATTPYTFTPNAGQCATTASMTVNVGPPAAPTFAQVAPICTGGSFTLPATSLEGFTGTWSPAINNTATTTYTFTPTAGQCATTTTMTVTVSSPITPAFDQWGPFCQNDIIIQVILPETSNEGITGTWNPAMVSTAVAGNIIHTFTPDAGQCANSTTMTVTINALPVISTTAMVVSNENCGQNDGSISGITVSGGAAAYSYSWNNDPALNTIDIASLSSGTYNLIVTDGLGCTAEENVTVLENAAPVIDDAGLTLVQPTCVLNGSVSGLTVTGSNPFTYAWTNTTQTTLNITNLTAGGYSLTVTDNNGCTTSYGPVNLIAPIGATASFNWTPTEPNEGEAVTFTNTSTGTGAISSTWTIQGANQNTTNASSIFTAEGNYTVVLSIVDANGCVDTVTQSIAIFGNLVIPNVITANGDGVNDKFEIQGLKANTELIIIDRWGVLVFKTDDYKNDWGGKDLSGNDLTDGVYTYSYKTTDGKQGHGFVHLIR